MWIHVAHAHQTVTVCMIFFLPRLYCLGGKCPEALLKSASNTPLCAPDTFVHDVAIRNHLSRTNAGKELLQFQWDRVLTHECSAGSHQLAVRVQFLKDQAHLLIHVTFAEVAAAAEVAVPLGE